MVNMSKYTSISFRVAARFQRSFDQTSTEFSSPEALRQYLKDHPQADKSLHTVKKPGDTDEKGEQPPKDDHGDAKHEPPKKSFKDRLKSLSQKAKNFVSNAPSEVKKFVQDDAHRRTVLMAAHKTLTDLPEKVYTNAKNAVKHEVHEFKTAGQGIKAVLKGGKMTPEQKHAVKVVAFDVALTVATAALTGGLGLGVKGLAGKSAQTFVTAMAKKIALKSVTHGLGSLVTVEELGHFGHGAFETIHHMFTAAEAKQDERNLIVAYCTKLVADQMKDLDPDVMAEALEEASKDD